MENRAYVLNKETSKIELHFSKQEYLALPEDLKKELKRFYLFSGHSQAWVSRGIRDHYWAIKTAEKLGFTEKEITGQRLSFQEELERKAEKAESRVERYEQYADNAEKRAENLQKDREKYRGDISFWTQPIIAGHSGSQSFARYRQRIVDRYHKGFEEYRKSEYFKERAETARQTASMEKLQDKVYLDSRIKECNRNIKKLQENVVHLEEILHQKENNITIDSFYNDKTEEQIQNWLNNNLEKMEYEIDKLAFLQNCLDELGGVGYSPDNIKPGYLVKIRGTWKLVLKANKKTIDIKIVEGGAAGMVLNYPYAEIQEIKIPENFKEINKKIETIENPYQVNDILTQNSIASDRIISAYQVIKVTDKTVTIQKIKLDENGKPILNNFKDGSEPERRKVTKSKFNGQIQVYNGDWPMYKYNV